MTFQQYLEYFELILHSPKPEAPYDQEEYLNYTKLNWSRMNRWLKKGEILDEVKLKILGIQQPQRWIVITEPWCGDASHVVPFIKMMSDLNPLISLDLELRDSEPFRIENYLTNGGKSIPKLIVQDTAGNDLAVWGPRPIGCQQLFNDLKAKQAEFEELKVALQNWYNEHQGVEIQQEIAQLL